MTVARADKPGAGKPESVRIDPQMSAIMENLAREDADLPDPLTLPAAEGRDLVRRINSRWNRDLPALDDVAEIVIRPGDHADPASGSQPAETLAARLYRPKGAGPGCVLYVHGGGWCFCGLDTHERAMRVLAIESGAAVLGIDYRLAPEHPYPAALDDCVYALRWLLGDSGRREVGAGRLVISGDSAGANLALASMLAERDRARPMPDGAALFYGVYSDDHATVSHRAFGGGEFGLSTAKMARYRDHYLPQTGARRDPLVSPLLAEFTGLPPMFVTSAGLDPLRDDSIGLCSALAAAGIVHHYRDYPGVIHGFMQMTGHLSTADRSMREAGAAIREMLAPVTNK